MLLQRQRPGVETTEEIGETAVATKYAAAQIESEVDGNCCPMQKQSSADEEGYLITESDALEKCATPCMVLRN